MRTGVMTQGLSARDLIAGVAERWESADSDTKIVAVAAASAAGGAALAYAASRLVNRYQRTSERAGFAPAAVAEPKTLQDDSWLKRRRKASPAPTCRANFMRPDPANWASFRLPQCARVPDCLLRGIQRLSDRARRSRVTAARVHGTQIDEEGSCACCQSSSSVFSPFQR